MDISNLQLGGMNLMFSGHKEIKSGTREDANPWDEDWAYVSGPADGKGTAGVSETSVTGGILIAGSCEIPMDRLEIMDKDAVKNLQVSLSRDGHVMVSNPHMGQDGATEVTLTDVVVPEEAKPEFTIFLEEMENRRAEGAEFSEVRIERNRRGGDVGISAMSFKNGLAVEEGFAFSPLEPERASYICGSVSWGWLGIPEELDN